MTVYTTILPVTDTCELLLNKLSDTVLSTIDRHNTVFNIKGGENIIKVQIIKMFLGHVFKNILIDEFDKSVEVLDTTESLVKSGLPINIINNRNPEYSNSIKTLRDELYLNARKVSMGFLTHSLTDVVIELTLVNQSIALIIHGDENK